MPKNNREEEGREDAAAVDMSPVKSLRELYGTFHPSCPKSRESRGCGNQETASPGGGLDSCRPSVNFTVEEEGGEVGRGCSVGGSGSRPKTTKHKVCPLLEFMLFKKDEERCRQKMTEIHEKVKSGQIRCTICQHKLRWERPSLHLPSCQHTFHKCCLQSWVHSAQSSSCPTCRTPLDLKKAVCVGAPCSCSKSASDHRDPPASSTSS